jgi:ATP-dependent Clp protease ATP-binding subunit ClpB
MTVVGQHFRPEFINRIDEAVVFSPLGSAQIRSIARVQSDRVVKRLADRGISLVFTDSALDLLAQAGYDPVYGARPLKRAIQGLVENPLARAVLDGSFASGDTVNVVNKDGALDVERAGGLVVGPICRPQSLRTHDGRSGHPPRARRRCRRSTTRRPSGTPRARR